MKAVVTGGLGFVGRMLARRLAEAGTEVVVLDVVAGDVPEGARLVTADISNRDSYAGLLDPGDVVFHLAGVRGALAERDFDLALRANLDGSRALLEACRACGGVRLVFASTLAIFGGTAMPESVDETTRPNPQTTYGTTKAAVELLVNDYRRKGYVDGRAGRLATVIVRPDAPALAASGFTSAVFREALAGRDYDLPVGPELRLVLIGIRTAVECLVRLGELPAAALGDDAVLNLPSLSVTAGDLADAALRIGPGVQIGVRRDAAVESMVGGWPQAARADRALALGLPRDESLHAIVRDYVEEAARR